MGHNDYEQTTCLDSPDMNYKEALAKVAAIVGHEWAPFAADFCHLTNCSADQTANTSRCCDIIRLILLDRMFDCDIRRIFNTFYSTRTFSNGIVAHWINAATIGTPLPEWPSYDPSAPKYFHLTPDQSFVAEDWYRNCSFFRHDGRNDNFF